MLGEVDLFGSGFCGEDGFRELIDHTVEEERRWGSKMKGSRDVQA